MTRVYTRNGKRFTVGASRSGSRILQASASASPGAGALALTGFAPSTVDPAALWSIGGNLHGINDWEDIIYIDVARGVRGWDSDLTGQYVDTQGNLADGSGNRTFFLWSDGDRGYPVSYRGGTFRVTYEGTATVSGGGISNLTQNGTNDYTFTRVGTDGNSWLTFSNINWSDRPRNVKIIRTDLQSLYDAGEIFDPDYIGQITGLRCLRNLDAMKINSSTVTGTGNAPLESWQAWKIMPISVFIKLCNKIGADAWVCFPHQSDAALQNDWLTQLRDDLGASQRVFVEYSNEVWNFGPAFSQTAWVNNTAATVWSTTDNQRLWNYKAKLSTELAQRARAIFGSTTRLCMVMGTQTTWPQSTNLLTAPMWQEKEPGNYVSPAAWHDAWAITTYFGNYEPGSSNANANRSAFSGFEGNYAGYVAAVNAYLDSELTAWESHLTTNAGIASTNGLDLMAYEAMHHFEGEPSGVGSWYRTFHEDYCWSSNMASRVTDTFTMFKNAGGKTLCAFNWGGSGRYSVSSPWGINRYRNDPSALPAAIKQWGIDNPKWW